MATATANTLGLAHHGRPLTGDEFWAGDYEEGYQYELIDGRLYVTHMPNFPQGAIEQWVYGQLLLYSLRRPDILKFIHYKAHVYVPGRPGLTIPEPDVAAYREFPTQLEPDEIRWEDISPALVVEVVSPNDPRKDLVRNVELYGQVPSIKEYWILDNRRVASRPTLRVYRRRGKSWMRPIELAYGETYATKLLPEFVLKVDPRS